MAATYSIELCDILRQKVKDENLHRDMHISRYDPGAKLVYDMTPIGSSSDRSVALTVKKFVGGGFAGQVYQVVVDSVSGESIPGLTVGQVYALKIFLPPSQFSVVFRNFLYWVGFQGPFQIQVNPTAAHAGALWQKFIRRGAAIRFGDEECVNDVHATFTDFSLGSCGEISNWVEGRTWRLEVDDHLDALGRWKKGKQVDTQLLGSPEYRAKRKFMHEFVDLLHDMGAHEFARQYEWSTCKSQPNCLKRTSTNDDPHGGLVAVDFRAGLALLPFLPMSPGDVILIFRGLARGSLVQFDRGNLQKLRAFVSDHEDRFDDLIPLLDQLENAERVYRDSIPDITHNHFRLLFSPKLWATMLSSSITSWRIRSRIDTSTESRLRNSTILTFFFGLLGLIPFLGGFFQKLIGNYAARRHYLSLMNISYLQRTLRAKRAETLITWHRQGRTTEERSRKLFVSPLAFTGNLILSIFPVGIHRFLTDGAFARQRLHDLLVRPIKLYFNADLREQWLRDMVAEGRKKHIISTEDAETVLSRIKEPYIQKYLKSLAVHLCTAPVTQVVSILLAVLYVVLHPEMPRAQAWTIGLGIVALFQVVPLSPGSLTRGLYVLYLVIKERNFKDYNIAVFLGFFKYVGYLAFPIQMAYRYPTLARFMAGHWATEAVHIVPVFGEGGALLEHSVFNFFYNFPLTVRRRMTSRAEVRTRLKPRLWHAGIYGLAMLATLVAAEYTYFTQTGQVPTLQDLWWLIGALPVLGGIAITIGAGGMSLWKRVVTACCTSVLVALSSPLITPLVLNQQIGTTAELIGEMVWSVFVFSLFSSMSVLVTEAFLPDPQLTTSGAASLPLEESPAS